MNTNTHEFLTADCADFFLVTKAHKSLFWIAFILFLIVLVATIIVFVPRALHHTVEGGANVIS